MFRSKLHPARGVFAVALLAFASCSAMFADPKIVISQVYGGGGNSGATLTNDFIEIFNTGDAPMSLAGWSVQYNSAAGTSAWQVTNLTGSIAAGQYYLIQEAKGAGGTTALPTPDATGTIPLSGSTGRVALVSNTTALSAACPTGTGSTIVDVIGFGPTASCFETSPTAVLSNLTAALRNASGCTDTDNNVNDFTIAAPAPRNTGTTLNPCVPIGPTTLGGVGTATPNSLSPGSQTTLSATVTPGSNPASTGITVSCDASTIGGSTTLALTGTGPYTTMYTIPLGTNPAGYSLPCTVADLQSRSSNFTIALTVTAPATVTQIYQITGSGATSPKAGAAVTTRGVVTAIRAATSGVGGFYIESLPADRDADPNTSEGLLVFTGSSARPACAVVGNSIQIDGVVSDFVPSTAPVGSFPLTELGSPANCQILATDVLGSLPAPVTIAIGSLDPNGTAIQSRKWLAMRVTVPTSTVVGPSLGNLDEPNETATPNGQFFITTLAGGARSYRKPGILDTRRPADAAATVPGYNGNPEVLRVDTTALAGPTAFEVAPGTTVSNLSGVMDYTTSQGQYTLYSDAAEAGTYSPSTPTISAIPVPAALSTDLTIADFNIQRFYNDIAEGNGAVTVTTTAYQGRLNKLSLAVRNVLNTPDIIGFEEVEAPTLASGSSSFPVITDIVAKLNTDAVNDGKPNPNYGWCMFGTNDPSAINVAVVYKKDKVALQDCAQYGGGTTFVEPGGASNTLNDRPPVTFKGIAKAPGSDSGLPIRIVVNHLRSLGSVDQPGIGNGERVRTKRNQQAIYLAKLISGLLPEQTTNWNTTDNLILVGDFNAYQFNDGYVDSLGCITGLPSPADTQYFTAAQLAVDAPCTAIPSPTLTNLTTLDPLDRYSYTFSGVLQSIDHAIINGKLLPRVRQAADARNDADFPEGPTYKNNFNRPERLSDHDMPVVYVTLPMEITSRVTVNGKPVALNRATHRYNGQISITNTGGVALTGPLYVFFNNLTAAATLPDLPTQNGVPYATINLPGGLAPGATSALVTISFADPTNAPISFSTTVFDGIF